MKKTLLIATILSVVALNYVFAQQRSMPSSGGMGIAVIDIAYVFKNHNRFKQNMEFMKKDVMAAEETLKQERDLINKMVEKLKDFNPGTPDYKKLEEDITHRQSDFNVRAQLQKKEFLEREAKVYTNIYKEVADEVKIYSETNGIAIVLRFNGDPVDPNNRNSVLGEINKPIVYQRTGIDITPYILDSLNRRGQGTVNGGPNGMVPRGGPITGPGPGPAPQPNYGPTGGNVVRPGGGVAPR